MILAWRGRSTRTRIYGIGNGFGTTGSTTRRTCRHPSCPRTFLKPSPLSRRSSSSRLIALPKRGTVRPPGFNPSLRSHPGSRGDHRFRSAGAVIRGARSRRAQRAALGGGLRRLLQDEDHSFFELGSFAQGLDGVARRGWTFDACVRWHQLEDLYELARRHEDLPLVLDHLGKPPLNGGPDEFARWREALARLAELPNTAVKLSGYRRRRRQVHRQTHSVPGFAPLTTSSVPADR